VIARAVLAGVLCAGLAAQEAAETSTESPSAPPAGSPAPIFYKPLPYGSSSEWNPLHSWVTWAYDSGQVTSSFDDYHMRERWGTVKGDLTHVGGAIHQRGTWADFINRQVIPYRFTEKDWVPNYALHLLGGGMVHLKTKEWFEAQGVPLPWLASAIWCTSSELYQEVLEKSSTKPDDEVADVLIFLPASFLLYSYEPFARWAADTLHLEEWNYQPMWSPDQEKPVNKKGRLVNVGENYVVRPEFFGWKDHRPFVFFGMTTVFGLSHKVTATDSISWGVGAAMRHAQDPTATRTAGGLFWDRNGSLLASLILNGTENLKARLNVYPGALGKGWWSPGIYVGYGDHKEVQAGLTLRCLPLGWARRSVSPKQ
jgi:hypothetical protein